MADKNVNMRRVIADGIFNPLMNAEASAIGDGQTAFARDPRNPYAALVTTADGRTFRIIVKEVES